jgi:hypothetical protein
MVAVEGGVPLFPFSIADFLSTSHTTGMLTFWLDYVRRGTPKISGKFVKK